MKTIAQSYTHKGWFGLCPVHLGNLEDDAPNIDPRHPMLSPLMDLSEVLFGLMFQIAHAMNPSYEPLFPLRVTGQLSPPIIKLHEVNDAP
jgi:hypothetical protein